MDIIVRFSKYTKNNSGHLSVIVVQLYTCGSPEVESRNWGESTAYILATTAAIKE